MKIIKITFVSLTSEKEWLVLFEVPPLFPKFCGLAKGESFQNLRFWVVTYCLNFSGDQAIKSFTEFSQCGIILSKLRLNYPSLQQYITFFYRINKPHFARLNGINSAWCSNPNDIAPFIRVDYDSLFYYIHVCFISTPPALSCLISTTSRIYLKLSTPALNKIPTVSNKNSMQNYIVKLN